MKHAVFIAIGAALIVSAVLQLCADKSRRNYWRSVEQIVEQRAAETVAAQELAIKSLKEATNQMQQANAAAKNATSLLTNEFITTPIVFKSTLLTNFNSIEYDPYMTHRFYDDRTNLVLTVIHTNGTWIAIKP